MEEREYKKLSLQRGRRPPFIASSKTGRWAAQIPAAVLPLGAAVLPLHPASSVQTVSRTLVFIAVLPLGVAAPPLRSGTTAEVPLQLPPEETEGEKQRYLGRYRGGSLGSAQSGTTAAPGGTTAAQRYYRCGTAGATAR
jgi:hypothetical protein